jgi:rhamnosyl/mannosyltransferase
MKVLHFFKTYYPDSFGGVERTIHAIAKGCHSQGIESDVLSLSPQPAKNTVLFDGHTAYKAKLDFEFASTGFSREAFSKFRQLAAKVDIIHYHFPWPFMDLVHLSQRSKKPSIVTYHSDVVKQKTLLKAYQPLMHRFLSSVDRIVATSDNYFATSAVLQRYRDKVEVIPLGLDEADYPRAPESVKQAWHARFPRPFFLFVGVLRYYKGLQYLLDAAKDLPADIVIMGNGPMETELKAQAAKQQLMNVHFLESRSDLDKAALLELCRAFVFPSHLRSEAFGLSLVEASMFGKAMITCEIGTGTSFINLDGETGLVVPAADATALNKALRQLLIDPSLIERFEPSSRARYLSNLTSRQMSDRYASLYLEGVHSS